MWLMPAGVRRSLDSGARFMASTVKTIDHVCSRLVYAFHWRNVGSKDRINDMPSSDAASIVFQDIELRCAPRRGFIGARAYFAKDSIVSPSCAISTESTVTSLPLAFKLGLSILVTQALLQCQCIIGCCVS